VFTGIVEEIGSVSLVQPDRLTVKARTVIEGTRIGDSMAVNGACLTVTDIRADTFTVEVMPETLRRTTTGRLRVGDVVNLERAVQMGGRMGGHMVQGHVDDTGRVTEVKPEGPAVLMRFAAPREVMRYVVLKGFIAVDGTSLTVVARDEASFTVSLVGITRQSTTLGKRRVGDTVNLEVDIIAKYVEALAEKGGGVSMDFLREHGFGAR